MGYVFPQDPVEIGKEVMFNILKQDGLIFFSVLQN